jgi:hypothetical protein
VKEQSFDEPGRYVGVVIEEGEDGGRVHEDSELNDENQSLNKCSQLATSANIKLCRRA